MSPVFVALVLCVLWLSSNVAVNHWELTSDGSIQPQVDFDYIFRIQSGYNGLNPFNFIVCTNKTTTTGRFDILSTPSR